MRRSIAAAALLASLATSLALPRAAHATAFGSMFSGPTTADGASVLWNPAAMTLLRGTAGHLYGGASVIRLQFQRTTVNPVTNQQYPQADLFTLKPDIMLGIVTDATLERFRFGIGFNIPILDGAKWKETYAGQPSSTRYFALEGRQAHFVVRPAVAFKINKYISVGLGVDITIVQLKHEAMTDFSAKINQIACNLDPQLPCNDVNTPLVRENPQFDALTTIDGLGVGVGISGGILVTPFRWLRFGANITSGARDVTVKSDLHVDLPKSVTDYLATNFPTVSLSQLDAKGDIISHNPLSISLGLAVNPIPKLELAVDWHWIQKSKMSALYGNITQTSSDLIGDQVLIKILADDWLLGFRAQYQVLPWLKVGLRFEADPNARPERYMTPVSIDFDKYQLIFGVALRATRWLAVTAEYGRYFLVSRTITQSNFAPSSNPTTELAQGFDKPYPLGRYGSQVDRFAVGVNFGF